MPNKFGLFADKLRVSKSSELGAVVHADALVHYWFEERGPRCILLFFVDEATGRLMHLMLSAVVNIWSLFEATRQYILQHGKPLAFSIDNGLEFRQFGRAMREIDINCVRRPPLAPTKGRIERVSLELLERLPSELKRKNISSIAEANRCMLEVLTKFNKVKSLASQAVFNVHCPVCSDDDFDHAMTIVTKRVLRKDFSVKHDSEIYYVDPKFDGHVPRCLLVREDSKGYITIEHKGKPLNFLTPNGQLTSTYRNTE